MARPAGPAPSTTLGLFVAREKAPSCKALSAEDLRWVGWNVANQRNPDAIWLDRHGPPGRMVLLSSSLEVHFSAVAAGVGVGLLPRELASRDERFAEIDLGIELPAPMPIFLVCHRAIRRVPRIDATWQFLHSLIANMLS